MTSPSQDIQQDMANIQSTFTDALPRRLADMAALISSLRLNWNDETADALYREAHSLAGAGATFGMAEVSSVARIMQYTVQTLRQQNNDPDPTAFSALDQLMTELSTAITAPGILNTQYPTAYTPSAANISPRTTKVATLNYEKLKILVADDDPFGLEHLRLLLQKDGHEVIAAEDGAKAVALFKETRPDLVILDVIMPTMNGIDAAKQIKQETGNHFVPIMFLTSLESDDDIVDCIEAGGDDFLSKPLNFVILRARIHALQRIRSLYRELEVYHQRTEEEIRLSKHVFNSITNRNSGDREAISIFSTASGHFSGDLVCYQESRNGAQYVMIGDFTGHGLIAALGAIPVTDVFYTMAKQGFCVGDIAYEINNKLNALLPTSRFLAAGFFKINPVDNSVEHWFGGLPPAMLRKKSGEVELLKTDKLALGIIGSEQFDSGTDTFSLEDFSDLFLYSDGLTEAANSLGDMFGEEAVIEIIESQQPGGDIINAVVEKLTAFTNIDMADDDITLVNVELPAFVAEKVDLLLQPDDIG